MKHSLRHIMFGHFKHCVIIIAFSLTICPLVFAADLEYDTYQSGGATNPRWDSLVLEGFKLYLNRQYTQALDYLLKAYDAGCRDGLVVYRIAYSYSELKQCDKLFFYGEQAIPKLQQQYPKHYYNGTIYQAFGICSRDDQKAIEYYVKVLEFDPFDVTSRLNMANRLLELKRYDEAEKNTLFALNYCSKSKYGLGVTYRQLGEVYYRKKNYAQAVEYFEKALYSCNYSKSKMLWWLAYAHQELGHTDQAMEYWKATAQAYGENSETGRAALEKYNTLKNQKR